MKPEREVYFKPELWRLKEIWLHSADMCIIGYL